MKHLGLVDVDAAEPEHLGKSRVRNIGDLLRGLEFRITVDDPLLPCYLVEIFVVELYAAAQLAGPCSLGFLVRTLLFCVGSRACTAYCGSVLVVARVSWLTAKSKAELTKRPSSEPRAMA
jgi:hypothetical protein